MLYDAGIDPPPRVPVRFGGLGGGSAIPAETWASPHVKIPDWEYKGSNIHWQRGDVIANEKHCGIATGSSTIMAAGRHNVNDGSEQIHKLSDGSVRRYTGS